MTKHLSKKRIILIILIASVAALFVFVARSTKKPALNTAEIQKPIQEVSVQSVSGSQSFQKNIQYPATIVGDQEIEVTATSSGTAKIANYALGSRVGAGSLLVQVDDSGNNQLAGDSGFKSTDVQESELSVKKAEEELDIAKNTYNNLKDQYDYEKKHPELTQTVTKTQRDNAKEAVDIAEINLKNQKVGYKGSLDNHLITSPISGYVTQKLVSAGDSVAVGTPLFKISKTMNVKIQFFVDEQQLASISKGMTLDMTDSSGNAVPVVVRNISPQADSATKRFLIEAYPKTPSSGNLFSGTIVSVSFSYSKTPGEPGTIILPLSAVNIGQNENYIFIAENGKAKKFGVEIAEVSGETADVKTDLPADAEIIVGGSKLVQDGTEISIAK